MLHLKYDQPKTLLKRIDEGGHKTGIKLYIYHPINLHGVEIRFLTYFTQGKELWLRQT